MTDTRLQAIQLRRQGKSYSEIQSALGLKIPKATLSYWCSGLEMTDKAKKRLERKILKMGAKGRKAALIAGIARQQAFLASLKTNNEYLKATIANPDVAKIALAILYLGEGAKWSRHRGLMLGSSDPDIIKIYISLLEKCYGIQKEVLKIRVSHRFDQNLKSLNKYWSKVTGVPLKNFYKSIPDPRTKGKKTLRKNYKGVCVISCAGTKIQLELDTVARMLVP